MKKQHDSIRPIVWQDDHLELLDQRVLPHSYKILEYTDVHEVADAIRDMIVRGAPAIGITAAYGIVLAARQRYAENSGAWKETIQADLDYLAASRPTAVNLFWAIDRMKRCISTINGEPVSPLLAEAIAIHEEDIAANYRMGELGAELIEPGSSVLTHSMPAHWQQAAMVLHSALFVAPMHKVKLKKSMPTKPDPGCKVVD